MRQLSFEYQLFPHHGGRHPGRGEVIADDQVNVYVRNERFLNPAIARQEDVLVNLHDLSREISGVEVGTFRPDDLADWHMTDKTPNQAMSDAAWRNAETMGLINNVNRDHAYVVVDFHDTDHRWHCYLEFEEGV
jgi:hypothetical protein